MPLASVHLPHVGTPAAHVSCTAPHLSKNVRYTFHHFVDTHGYLSNKFNYHAALVIIASFRIISHAVFIITNSRFFPFHSYCQPPSLNQPSSLTLSTLHSHSHTVIRCCLETSVHIAFSNTLQTANLKILQFPHFGGSPCPRRPASLSTNAYLSHFVRRRAVPMTYLNKRGCK